MRYYPPIGGKITVLVGGEKTIKLEPRITAWEHSGLVTKQRQEGHLGEIYVHQMTVQGKLPDKFKYMVVGLILSSPYSNDWSHPFFEAAWGKLAPLIHDGGNTEENYNYQWRYVDGRTDFLHRVARVDKMDLETVEQLPVEGKKLLTNEELEAALAESQEKNRLLLETRAYQALALALHAQQETAPVYIPETVVAGLINEWQIYEQKIRGLLSEYDMLGIVEVPWFTKEPRRIQGWEHYGERYEADWPPIQEQLVVVERRRREFIELRERTTLILEQSVMGIEKDNELDKYLKVE